LNHKRATLRYVCFKLAFDLHLVVLGVFYTELKECPHANSELSDIAKHFSWQVTLGIIHLDLFVLPVASSEAVKAKVNLFAKHIVFNFVFLQTRYIIKMLVKLLNHIKRHL